MNKWEYKGFQASVEFSPQDNLIVGKIASIDSLVMFSAENVTDLHDEFVAAVDGYLEHCEDLGIQPQKPYKGSFNVRCGSELHRNMDQVAKCLGISLNEAVKRAFLDFVEKANQKDGSSRVLVIEGKREFPMSLQKVEMYEAGQYLGQGISMSSVGEEEQLAVLGRLHLRDQSRH